MKVVIIDDEKHAIDLLEFHLQETIKDIDIIGKFNDAASAIKFLMGNQPDLIFTDVDMPGLNGVELTSILEEHKTPIVFVTAHSKYAMDAVKLNVFDYLLKPINQKELERIHQKFLKTFEPSEDQKKIEFKISNRHVICDQDEIVYVNSEGNYTTIFFNDREDLMLTKNMKKVEEEYFGSQRFVRVHRSFIVNVSHVLEYNNFEILLSNKTKVPLARNKYEEFKEKMLKS